MDPGVLQGFHGRTEFFQNALIKDPLRRRENLRVIRFEKGLDIRRFRFRGVDPLCEPRRQGYSASGDFEDLASFHWGSLGSSFLSHSPSSSVCGAKAGEFT